MKKNAIFVLLVALMLSTLIPLSSCTRRGEFEDVLESQKESESLNNIPEMSDNITGENASNYKTNVILKTGNTPFYEGKTVEDLNGIKITSGNDPWLQKLISTGHLYYGVDGEKTYFYNKLTGNFSNWCADPLCDGEGCIWSNYFMEIQYVSDEYIYFLSSESNIDDRYGIFRCDLQRNNIEKILNIEAYTTYDPDYNGDGRADGSFMTMDSIRVVYEKDNLIYYLHIQGGEEMIEKPKMSVYTMDLNTKEKCMISGDLNIQSVYVINDMIYYTTLTSEDEPDKVYRSDLEFSTTEVFREGEYIDIYNDKYIITIERANGQTCIHNLKTGEVFPLQLEGKLSNSNLVLSGDYVYYSIKLNDTEIENDPLKDYYTYTWEEPSHRPNGGNPIQRVSDTQDAGMIYRKYIGAENAEEECVLQLTYKDIPVRIKTLEIDGEVLYISFHNYEGFTNFYNQDFKGNENRTVSYAVVDLQKGTVDLLKLPKED